MSKLWVFSLLPLALVACAREDPTFGASYDACVLRHGASNDAAKEICNRHFSRAPSQAEADAIRSASSVEVNFDQEPNLMTKTPWDKITASVINRSDDIVVTKVRITATFYNDKSRTKKLPDMPLTWDLNLDASDDNTEAVGLFDRDKAPSRFYRAYVDPIRVYSHTGRGG